MEEDQYVAVKEAVHKLQLFLLEGIGNKSQLYAAGTLMSRSDYDDVVTERSIAHLCGYPLCGNSLPSKRPRKGHYHISLNEHEVYDLHEVYSFCSSGCVTNSHTFAETLKEERCSTLNQEKMDEILGFFGESSSESIALLGIEGDFGLSKLEIQENVETTAGEVLFEDWIGPFNAIEGYVPKRDCNIKPKNVKNHKQVSEAGIILLPEDAGLWEPEQWPAKPGTSAPPVGFSLTLSPFATMWMALFSWITSSSIAYIYGREDWFHEEYSSVNGREYPQKIVSTDGHSDEIRQTLLDYLARALPGLAAHFRLPTHVSSLEQELGHLLETMSFVDELPSLRVKQWQVIALLFMDALSVCRIPALTPHLSSKRMLFPRVLDAAQVGTDEYEVMKDLIIPLGRVPQFSSQRGG